jgi:hypothetical protein
VPLPVSRDRSEYCTAVLTEYDDDGFIGVQIDAGGQTPGMQPFELHHPFGFASRCRDRETSGRGCTLRFCYEGDEGHAWLAVDPRCVDVIPSLAKGASVQYSYVGTFGMMDANEEDGTYTLYVPCAFVGGIATKAHLFQMGLDANGDEAITFTHADGMALLMVKNKAIVKNAAGDVYIELSPTGILLNGNVKVRGSFEWGPCDPASPAAFVALMGPAGPQASAMARGL